MSQSFKNKIVVVSGSSRGIGRGIAAAFAAQGAQTVLVASSHSNLMAAADTIERSGGPRPDFYAADLRTEVGCNAVFEHVAQRHGRCDILVNSAGATKAGAFLDLDEALWQDGFALKFFACTRLCRLFWPMLRQARGHVVNIIGGAARTPETERVEQIFTQRANATGTSIAEVRAAQIAKEGLARLGTPEDVAALTLFLCSESARHVQGTAISVDGGGTAGVY